jgi:hypothetical protein
MIPKMSLTTAFLLMVAPPIACASNRVAANPAPITRNAHESAAGMIVAQDDQPNVGTSDDNNGTDSDAASDSDSNDSGGDNQNADSSQTDQNAAGAEQQAIPPQVLNGPENDPDDAPDPNGFAQPVNPSQ